MRVLDHRADLDHPLLHRQPAASLQRQLHRHRLRVDRDRQSDLVARRAGPVERDRPAAAYRLIALRHTIADHVERLADVRQARCTRCSPAGKRAIREQAVAEHLDEPAVNRVEGSLRHNIDRADINTDIDEPTVCRELARAGDLLGPHHAVDRQAPVRVIRQHQQVALIRRGGLPQSDPLGSLQEVTGQQADPLGDVGQLRVAESELVERLAEPLHIDRPGLERLNPRPGLDAVPAHILESERQRCDRIGPLLRDVELAAAREYLQVAPADDVGDDVQVIGVEGRFNCIVVQRLGRHKVEEQSDLRSPNSAGPAL